MALANEGTARVCASVGPIAAAIVDVAAGGRVIVFGSPPPEGRDLDLLVRPGQLERLELRLRADGFVRKGETWARFAGSGVEAVDLVDAREWRLPEAELARLFADAVALDGFVNVVRPAPHDELLVLARLSRRSTSLPERRRTRFARAAAVPGAWSRAEELAPAWALERELAHLRRLASGSATASVRLPPRPRAPRVVSLSGIDGSGKTTQAAALRATLERLGHSATVAWMPLSHNPALDVVARTAKFLLGRGQRAEPAESRLVGVGGALRERSPAARLAWTLLVAGANAAFNARATLEHSLDGKIIVFDRFVLDSAARLRFQYGEDGRFRVHNALVRALAPRPLASFWLDVPAEAALARKDDGWTLEELRLQERLYREEARRLPVVRLDGLREPDEIAAEIAATVWQGLP